MRMLRARKLTGDLVRVMAVAKIAVGDKGAGEGLGTGLATPADRGAARFSGCGTPECFPVVHFDRGFGVVVGEIGRLTLDGRWKTWNLVAPEPWKVLRQRGKPRGGAAFEPGQLFATQISQDDGAIYVLSNASPTNGPSAGAGSRVNTIYLHICPANLSHPWPVSSLLHILRPSRRSSTCSAVTRDQLSAFFSAFLLPPRNVRIGHPTQSARPPRQRPHRNLQRRAHRI